MNTKSKTKKKPSKALAKTDVMDKALVKQLKPLAKSIVETAGKVLHTAEEMLERAKECGKLLLEAKESIPHGQFIPWMEENCASVSVATAQRYMKLSKEIPKNGMCGFKTIRQAYLACGVIKPKPQTQRAAPQVATTTASEAGDYLSGIGIRSETPAIDVPAQTEVRNGEAKKGKKGRAKVEAPDFTVLQQLVSQIMDQIGMLEELCGRDEVRRQLGSLAYWMDETLTNQAKEA